MAFHRRKLLFQNHHNHGNISPAPSPHESPVSQFPLPSTLPIPTPEINHVHILQIAVIVMGCMVGVTMFLCTISLILRGYYHSRRRNHNHSRSRSNSPILFDVNGDGDRDSRFSDDDEMERVIDHPIWFIRTEGLQQSVIDSITVFKYRKNEGLIEGTECSVCLGEFQQDENLRLLPKCDHAFHILCIDTWLRSHKNCPLCRALVVNGGGGGSDNLRVTVTDQSDSSVSGETLNQEGQIEIFDDVAGSYHVEESESSVMRFVGDDDSGVSSSDILPNFLAEEIQPVKRSISMDSSSASMVFHGLNSDRWISENDLNFGDKMNSSSKDMSKNGGGSSTVCKVASLGRALQKRPRSFSNNTKFLFSKHSRSQSSSLPL